MLLSFELTQSPLDGDYDYTIPAAGHDGEAFLVVDAHYLEPSVGIFDPEVAEFYDLQVFHSYAAASVKLLIASSRLSIAVSRLSTALSIASPRSPS